MTGGAGFIGSAFVRHAVRERGHEVLNLDKLTYAASLEALEDVAGDRRYRLVQADICDRAAVAEVRWAPSPPTPSCTWPPRAMSTGRSTARAPSSPPTSSAPTSCWMRRWPIGAALSAHQRDDFRFVHVSTDEVYGSLGAEGRFTEASRYDPNSPYAASKAAADHLARAWHRTYGLPVILTNCSNNYGPYQFPEKLIPLTIIKAMAGDALPVYGTGQNVRDWIHVEDHVRGIEAALTRGRIGEGYNFGGASERTNLEVVRAICARLDELRPDPGGQSRDRLIEFVADRPGHDARYAIDDAKARAELGWAPRETFESGLAATVDWYLEHRAWWEAIRSGRYTGDRLGLAREGAGA